MSLPRRPVRFVSTLVLLAFATALALAGPSVGPERLLRVDVPLDDPTEQLKLLGGLPYTVEYYDIKTETVTMIVPEAGLARLRALGFEPAVRDDVTPDESTYAALQDYTDEVESDAVINQAAANYPAIASRLEYAELTGEGRAVGLLKVSDNVDLDEPEPRILFAAQHHANEVMTPEVMVDMIEYLTQNYGIDPEVTAWVDNYQIYIIPCHNPDGTNYNFNVGSGWRKNRRDNGDGSFGVDLNRNYPYRWGPDGCNGSDGNPGSGTYRGPSAASEPETRGINALAQEIRPSISLTYHTSGQLVLHPFGCSPALPDDPDRRAHRDIGSMLGAVIENDARDGYYRNGTPPELLYSVDGGSDDWLHAIAGTVAFTIEMNTSQQPDYATWRDDTVLRNREGWKYLLRRLDEGAITGRVRDACTGSGLTAEVGIVEQLFTQGQELRTSVPGNGYFRRITVPGEFTWYADANGYRRQEWPVTVRFEPVERDVWLVPDGSHGLETRLLTVDDSGGDDEGELDPGEEADVWLTALASGEALTGVSATLTTDDVYLEILDGAAALPDLVAGAEGGALDPFRVRALADAPDGHEAVVTVTFTANETLCRDGDDATVRVTRGVPSCPFEEETLDVDPGWAVMGPPDGWEFGIPQGSGGNGGPTNAHTGDHVYGTNLDGNHGATAGEFVLTTTPFDLQGLRDAELRFWQWLNNEPGYDVARVEVSVDNQSWTEVWRGFGRDTGWEEYRIDLPPLVDDEDQVWVRFVLLQDGGGSRSGWYIDDVRFCGESFLTAGGKLKYESYVITEDDPLYGNADGAIDVGETVSMSVSVRSTRNVTTQAVSAVLTTSDPSVTIHNGYAFYPDVPAGGAAESLPPHFSFNAGPDCGLKIPFTLETRYEDGLSTLSHFTVPVGTVLPATLLVDDMETDIGWSVSGSADQGDWEWGVPRGNTLGAETTNPDEDHTPDPGSACFVTQNVPEPLVAPPSDGDVDGGSTVLTSPPLAAGDYETLELSYWRWFFREATGGSDLYRVEASGDGVNYSVVEEVGSSSNEWTRHSRELTELLTPSDGLRVRFVVTDADDDSIVEGGVDDLELSGTQWTCEDFVPPVLNPPNPVGNTLTVDKAGWDVRLDWQEPPSDPGHDPATYYSVTRSEQAGAGFSEIAEPTAELYVDVGAGGPSKPALYFYLVYAENTGGPE